MTDPTDHVDPFRHLDEGLPLALLPVRLETRVRPETDPPELLVRIYPDQLHLRAHDPRLTDREVRLGRQFWERTWRAADDEAAARRAWRALCDAVGPRRGAWVSRRLTPENPDARPDQPVPADADLPVLPELPTPPRRDEDDVTPVSASVLPDRWLVLGYAGDTRVIVHWCEPVPDHLQVGPDLRPSGRDDPPVVDGGMRWMVDFDEAVRTGMAARIPLPPAPPGPVDTLLVVGAKDSLDGEGAAGRLAELLDGHHYADGVALLPPGTPTNHLPDPGNGTGPGPGDHPAAGPPGHDPDHDRSFDRERRGPLFVPGDRSDGDRVTRALGLDPDVLAHTASAGARADATAGAMHTALWSATWGYYLRQIMRTVDENDIAHARELYRRHVRGRGPFPALRVGAQPYGLLPVIALDRWRPGNGDTADLPVVHLLRKLRGTWRRSVPRVPRLPGAPQPDHTLLELLSMQPTSVRYGTRTLLGPAYVRHLDAFIGLGVDAAWWDQQEQLADRLATELELAPQPWLRQAVWSPDQRSVRLPVVQPGPLSESAPPDPNYLEWIRGQGYLAVRDAEPKRLSSLLARLLRHATLLEYATAARRLLAAHGQLEEWEALDDELVQIDPGEPGATVWELLARDLPGATDGRSIGAHLDELGRRGDDGDGDDGEPAVTELAEFRRALDVLAATPAAELGRLLPEAVDCASHRLDAWVTAVADRRLAEVRRFGGLTGVALGGYGWLTGGELGAGRSGDPAGGYLHAPSPLHATTAAVLRGGRDAHRGDGDDSLVIDLSSRRLREVREVLGGVAQGQPLGALLGYRFERGLHEGHPGLELDQFIAPLRALAPLVPPVAGGGPDDAPDDGPREAVAARNVVDGLRLHRRWQRDGLPFGTAGLPADGTPEHAAIEQELARLDGLVDGLGDAAVAEGVHQLVQGNPGGMSATMSGLSRGDVPPAELDVARTPRAGAGLTHRVLVLAPEDAPPASWPAHGSVRARAEPRLNAWAAGVLGDPVRVRCRAGFVADGDDGDSDSDSGGILEPPGLRQVSLRELDLSPLDVVYAGNGPDLLLAELCQRVRHLLRRTAPAGVPPDVEVRVLAGRAGDWPADVVSFEELAQVARTGRELLAQARPLEATDLQLPPAGAGDGAAPDPDPVPDPDPGQLAARTDDAVAALRRARDDLAVAGPEQLPRALLAAAGFGVERAVPEATTGGVDPAQVEPVKAELEQRLARVDERESEFDRDSAGAAAQRAHDTERMAAVFGGHFRVLPLVRPAGAAQLAQAFAQGRNGGGTPGEGPPGSPAPLPEVTWIQRAARVRPDVSRLCDLLSYAEVLAGGTGLDLRVGQLPFQEHARWVGLPARPGEPFPSGRLSLVAHSPQPPRPDRPLAGLHVDEWQETVPDDHATTAVAFNYDQPNSHAPQAVLLAVPPDDSGWDLDTVVDTVRQTLELATLRAVDPDTLQGVGHYLPAVCLATNVRDGTVSTRFDDQYGNTSNA